MFWKLFANAFPRTLLIFAGLVSWVVGFAWLLAKAFPLAHPLLLLFISTLVCALLASLGRSALKMFFNI